VSASVHSPPERNSGTRSRRIAEHGIACERGGYLAEKHTPWREFDASRALVM
jgi:hypothetical protein